MAHPDLNDIARRIRFRLVTMSHEAKTPHLGSALSCVDILVAVYWGVLRIDPKNASDRERDRFILSKGHAATAWYVVLAEKGFFPEQLLSSFGQEGRPLAEQPSPQCAPGVELATGSLGHGLPVGVGMALAAQIQRRSYRVIVTLSDGELNEGSVWEAAMFAAARKLDNLVVIIDLNGWQATGRSDQIMALHPLKQKWESFGWFCEEVDGHHIKAIQRRLSSYPGQASTPTALIAHTTKGKGVGFMEDDNNWHYRVPNQEEVERARLELKQAGADP